MLGDKQHQISRGDNYNKFYLLLLFDHWGFGVWVCNWWVVRTHTCLKFTH